MKRVLSVIMILAMLTATLCLSACGSDNPLAGTYTLKKTTGYRSSVFNQSIGEVTLVIHEDNTGTLTMIGQTTKVRVDQKEQKISFDDGKNYTSYTLDGKTLTVGNENSSYSGIFKKQ